MKSDDLGILTFRTPLHESEYAKPSRGEYMSFLWLIAGCGQPGAWMFCRVYIHEKALCKCQVPGR